MHKVPCPLQIAAQTYGSHPAIISGNKVITYKEYYDMAGSVRLGLSEHHVKPGHRVGIVANNSWQYLILLQALFRLGSVACPVSPRFPEKSILAILEKIDCRTVIDPLDILSSSGSRHIQKIDLNDFFFKKTQTQRESNDPALRPDLEAEATIVLTSGTSGVPKAVLHILGNHYYSALGSNENIPVQPGDRWFLSLPLYHVGGLGIVFRMLVGGGAVVVPEGKETMEVAVARHDVTHVSLVSTQLYRWLNAGVSRKTADTLKAVLVGGGPVPTSLINQAMEAGLSIYTTYGLTEMASQVTTTTPNDPKNRLLTSGKVLGFRDLKIEGRNILVKGRTLFKGYVEKGRVTLPVDDDGWFQTDDMGTMDNEGYLSILGRKDNMFISGGENITPEEIEKQLCMLSGVAEAVVVPVKDREFGNRPVAFIKTYGQKDIAPPVLVADLEQHLPRFKIPVAFYAWPKAANKESIKLQRHKLKRLAESMWREQ